jgi:hypothetical protein
MLRPMYVYMVFITFRLAADPFVQFHKLEHFGSNYHCIEQRKSPVVSFWL